MGVIKIAAGVFLGLVAAFVAYQLYQHWELTRLAQGYAEQQKLEAEALQTRISTAAQNLNDLTSEDLVTFCGPSVRDHFSDRASTDRHMEYLGADNHRIEIEFLCSEGGTQCFRFGMQRVDEYSQKYPPDYETYITVNHERHDSRESQIKEMPCLLGLADKYRRGSTR
jgi:hypothetical protein